MKTRQSLVVSVLLLAVAAHPSWAGTVFQGECVGISDGDTISVMRNGKAEKIRLHGIDCPESSQAFGTKAKQFTATAFRQRVSVEVVDTDRYGRTVGIVTLPDGRILNHELVKSGLAWWYSQYAPGDDTLKQLQERARAEHVGLWSDPAPTAPWEFRNGTKDKAPDSAAANRPDAPRGPPAAADGPLAALGPNETVYVTATGSRYHREDCRYLTHSKRPVSHVDAIAQGLSACGVCKPAGSATQPPAPAAAVSASTDPAGANSGPVVYVTATGKKFHAEGCRYLSKSKIQKSYADALIQGYTACSVCGGGAAAAEDGGATGKTPNENGDIVEASPGRLKVIGTVPLERTYFPPPSARTPSSPAQETSGFQQPYEQSYRQQAPAASSEGSSQVYVTKTGKKYHRAGCRYLSKSQRAISLQDASSSGYSPCSVCSP
jgi:micrococcal nuclease